MTNIEKKRELILTDNLWKTLLLISMPVAISSMVIEIFSLFDVYFSSTIGTTEMAATVFVGPITSVVSAIGLGFSAACTALVARELGRKNIDKARSIFCQLILLTILIFIILVFVCLTFTNQILSLGGATGSLLEVSSAYFKIIILSLPLSAFANIYYGVQRAIGNNKHIMVVNIITIVIKFIISYILVILLEYGIEGLAYATLISNVVCTLIALYNIIWDKLELQVKIKSFKIDFKLILAVLLFSAPIIIEKSTQSFGNLVINTYATNLGEDVLSAYGVINRINSIVFGLGVGFGTALISIVGQNIVVGNKKRILEAKTKGIIMSLGIVLISLIIVFVFKYQISGVFSDGDENLQEKIIAGMNIYTISAIPWTIMYIYFGIFQGMKKTIAVLVVSLARLWIFRVLLVGILIKFTNMQEYAIWYGMLISNILALITTWIIYKVKFEKIFVEKNIEYCEKNIEY